MAISGPDRDIGQEPLAKRSLIQFQRLRAVKMPARALPGGPARKKYRRSFASIEARKLQFFNRPRRNGRDVAPVGQCFLSHTTAFRKDAVRLIELVLKPEQFEGKFIEVALRPNLEQR